MVYIRSKSVKGDKYLYLVKSIWDPKKSTSKQEIIKYLGKATKVTTEDVPIDYRNDPKIIAFLSSHIGDNIKNMDKLIGETRDSLFDSMTKGDLNKTLDIFDSFIKNSSLENFYQDILTTTLYKIGDQWEADQLSVAAEHVASNITKELIGIISEKRTKSGNKAKVLLCTPVGEEHNIGCQMLQSFLQSKGYRVFNLSPSAPSESILNFIEMELPHIVMISIAIEDNVKAGQRLINKIVENHKIPILIGGQALKKTNAKFNAKKVIDEPLNKIPRIINQCIKIN